MTIFDSLRRVKKSIRRANHSYKLASPFRSFSQINDFDDKYIEAIQLLRKNGIAKISSFLSLDEVEAVKRMYQIVPENFSLSNSSLGFYVFDSIIYKALCTSAMFDLLKNYYQQNPVLQERVSLSVLYPGIDQEQYVSTSHHIPAGWHVDYSREVTIHIPLTEITPDTSHTKFVTGSHKAIFWPLDSKKLNDSFLFNNFSIDTTFSKPGDLVIMDTSGLHRAHLVKESFRAHLHFKFTPGNQLITYAMVKEKYERKIALLKSVQNEHSDVNGHCQNFSRFINQNIISNEEREFLRVYED